MNEIQYSHIHSAWMETLRMKNPPTSMLSVVNTGSTTAGPTSPRIAAAMENPISMAVEKLTTHAVKKNPNVLTSSSKPTLQYRTPQNAAAAATTAGISTNTLCAT